MSSSGPIQVIPPGFLGWLQLKNTGKAPYLLPDELQGTLDLTNWYLQAKMEDQPVTFNVLAAGAPVEVSIATVDNGQWWWIENFSLLSPAMAANDRLTWAPMIQQPTTVAMIKYLVGDYYDTGLAAVNERASASSRGGFFAPPGATLLASVIRKTLAGNLSCQASYRYCRLPV